MNSRSKEPNPLIRAYLFNAVLFLGVVSILVSLGYRQLVEGGHWSNQMARSTSRIVKIPPPRGLILDRNGVVLVDNRPSFNVALYLDEFGIRRGRTKDLLIAVTNSIQMLSRRMKIPAKVKNQVILNHYSQKGPLPLTVWNDLNPAALAAFEERSPWLKGVDLQINPVRVYPHGKLAAHILGRVGKPEDSVLERSMMFDEKGRRSFVDPIPVGKSGIEYVMESNLKGEPGERIVRLNAMGMKEEEINNQAPSPGRNVILTLDEEIQKIVEDTYPDFRGAVIVMNPNNGDVLAMASFPSYDPNLFIPAIRSSDWSRLINDPHKPLINRAIQGGYHPGSTFKVVTALAGLTSGTITPSTIIECTGSFFLGRIEFRCWQHGGHGDVNLKEAIASSCNVFFYTLGSRVGGDALWAMGQAFGLGEPTGIDLPYESKGLLPTQEWKKAELPRDWKWTTGDSVNMSIGQGYLEVTPLQMAIVASTMANGGKVYKPRIVDRVEDRDGRSHVVDPIEVRDELPVTQETMKVVRDAMFECVQGEHGTGKSARQKNVKLGAKTGSAQNPPIRDSVTGEVVKNTTAWMISFAPFEKPKYAIAVVAEQAVSGGGTCGPITGEIYRKIFELEEDRKHPRPTVTVTALPVTEKIEGFEGEASGEYLNQTDLLRKPPPPQETDEDDSLEEPPRSVPAGEVLLP